VGGGRISEGKVAGLLSTGAKIKLVSPKVTPKIVAWHRSGRLRWVKRTFRNSDMDGVFLVVAATSSSRVHRAIYQQARKGGILCNIVDVPELCDFYYPAVVQRGDLQIAISTAGASPSLAKRIRQQLESEFGPEYADWLRALAHERGKIRQQKRTTAEQVKLLEALASEAAFLAYQRECAGKKSAK